MAEKLSKEGTMMRHSMLLYPWYGSRCGLPVIVVDTKSPMPISELHTIGFIRNVRKLVGTYRDLSIPCTENRLSRVFKTDRIRNLVSGNQNYTSFDDILPRLKNRPEIAGRRNIFLFKNSSEVMGVLLSVKKKVFTVDFLRFLVEEISRHFRSSWCEKRDFNALFLSA